MHNVNDDGRKRRTRKVSMGLRRRNIIIGGRRLTVGDKDVRVPFPARGIDGDGYGNGVQAPC